MVNRLLPNMQILNNHTLMSYNKITLFFFCKCAKDIGVQDTLR